MNNAILSARDGFRIPHRGLNGSGIFRGRLVGNAGYYQVCSQAQQDF
jgi:hypothetical protein